MGTTPAQLVLRDVHVPAAPPWWPPAPGWWLLFAVVACSIFVILAVAMHRRRRQKSWEQLFDATAALPPSAERVAAISGLLRRAARKVDPVADKLQGEAWLHFLDGGKHDGFSAGAGRLLLEGGFRRDIGEAELERLVPLARARFLELMAKKR